MEGEGALILKEVGLEVEEEGPFPQTREVAVWAEEGAESQTSD